MLPREKGFSVSLSSVRDLRRGADIAGLALIASRATCVATAAATAFGCCATLRSVGSEAGAFGTVTWLLSPKDVVDDPGDVAEVVALTSDVMPVEDGVDTVDRDPTRLGVRRCAGEGTVTRAAEGNGAGALRGEPLVLAAAGEAVRDDSAGAAEDTGTELAAGVVPDCAPDAARWEGACGPPARDSTRRA